MLRSTLAFPLAWPALLSALAGCGRPPLSPTPLPAAAPTCPADGCAGPGKAPLPRTGPVEACFAAGSDPCLGAPAARCTANAFERWEAAGDARGLSCVVPMLAVACARGDARACSIAGRLRIEGRGADRDPARGLAMLALGCDRGSALGCAVALRWLGDPAHNDDGDDTSALHTRLESENACWLGQSDVCAHLGHILLAGADGSAADSAQAARVFAYGCDLGDRASCQALGSEFAEGEGVARDLERAVVLYERACRLGLPVGCTLLGAMLERGTGAPRDVARARALYRDACAAGDSTGCRHAEMLAASGADVPRDSRDALAYWQHRCEGQHEGRACAFESLIYLEGADGVERDDARSFEALSRACKLKYPSACEWLHEAQEE